MRPERTASSSIGHAAQVHGSVHHSAMARRLFGSSSRSSRDMSVCANLPSGCSVKMPWQDRARRSRRRVPGSVFTAAARSSTAVGPSSRASATPSRAAARRAAAQAAPNTSSRSRMDGGGAV
ncbi:hypothetical protein RKD46_004161 [Streptomyces pseudovenezuelae]